MTSGTNWSQQGSSLPRRRRAVVFEDSWYTSATKISHDVRRIDEVCEGIFWYMEFAADMCPAVPDTPFHVAKALAPDGKRLRAFFTVNDGDDPAVRAWYLDVIEDEPAAEEEDEL